jgi:hypothetical protein
LKLRQNLRLAIREPHDSEKPRNPRRDGLQAAVAPEVFGPFSITDGYGAHAALTSTETAMAVLSFGAVKQLTKGTIR